MNLRIEHGHVVDPANGINGQATIVVRDGLIAEVTPTHQTSTLPSVADEEHIDANGLVVCPGLFDMHVHFRDPGYEYKEDIVSGSEAAVRGGFTAVACMPNTQPVNDTAAVTEYMLRRAQETDRVRLYPIAAITRGLLGRELCEFGSLKDAGAIAFSDDGMPVTDGGLMRHAMEYASQFNMPIIEHCEDLTLSGDGVMHEGVVSGRLGLRGIPAISEAVHVHRLLEIARVVDCQIHICHVSCRETVALIREAKQRGIRITAEVTPHHLHLLDAQLADFDTNFKCKPPIVDRNNQEALLEGLADGTLDVIATDHAPHAGFEKQSVFDAAPFGMIGLETALPLGLALVERGVLPLEHLIATMSNRPAEILGLDIGTLSPGREADITLIDPNVEYTLSADDLRSKSCNSPFLGVPLKGRAVRTIRSGITQYKYKG